MKAVILAGGRGTRLAPYTSVFPKPLVPIGQRPVIDIIINQLAGNGFSDVVLTTGYLAELIEAYFATYGTPEGIKLSYIREKTPSGTAGSLASVPGIDDTFLVMNGDVLTTLDYRGLVQHHRDSDALLTVAVQKKGVKIDLGVVETDDAGRMLDYIEKPTKNYRVSMGVYVYEPEVLRYIQQGQYLDFPDLALRLLEAGEKVSVYSSDDYWVDIGNHQDYERAQEEFEGIRHLVLPSGEAAGS